MSDYSPGLLSISSIPFFLSTISFPHNSWSKFPKTQDWSYQIFQKFPTVFKINSKSHHILNRGWTLLSPLLAHRVPLLQSGILITGTTHTAFSHASHTLRSTDKPGPLLPLSFHRWDHPGSEHSSPPPHTVSCSPFRASLVGVLQSLLGVCACVGAQSCLTLCDTYRL